MFQLFCIAMLAQSGQGTSYCKIGNYELLTAARSKRSCHKCLRIQQWRMSITQSNTLKSCMATRSEHNNVVECHSVRQIDEQGSVGEEHFQHDEVVYCFQWAMVKLWNRKTERRVILTNVPISRILWWIGLALSSIWPLLWTQRMDSGLMRKT